MNKLRLKVVISGAIACLFSALINTPPGSAAPSASQAAGPVVRNIKVIHLNIAGAQGTAGSDPNPTNPPWPNGNAGQLAPVFTKIAQHPEAVAVTLNEVCMSQYEAFVNKPGFENWYFRWSYTQTTNPKNSTTGLATFHCAQGTDRRIGEMIASRYPLSYVSDACVQLTPDPREADAPLNASNYSIMPVCPADPGPTAVAKKPESRSLLCASPQIPGIVPTALRICTTHLQTFGSFEGDTTALRTMQVEKIDSLLQPIADTDGIVVTGDMNTIPSSTAMNPIYGQRLNGDMNGPGSFYEGDSTDENQFSDGIGVTVCRSANPTMCRTGADTGASAVDKKIDYVFFSRVEDRTNPDTLNLIPYSAATSDHKLLVASASMRLRTP